ncbi:aldehyde dehydrogenase [Roseibium aggregatum IAM 12614]|uniref:Aldehyde dehydrogenase n=1 Tax=Roseibium aggregatum (strain ATCC 25650 / DSM 13394 / JCM 20685 / NBRC 16684 / NCIMB 2208 / IAM 12614 / B1) TaxID=384765 RepID=A0NZD2_ROSAI|nr:aldehyde dehydrogenase family protein [Roseibium aggregatum]EAV41811.1 aldehyde dehydrogenase [Roseibium aggregatum IAM 12614]
MSLSFDPASPNFRSGHFIAGEFVADEPQMAMHRPSDGAEFAGCPIADADTVDRAVRAAGQALKQSGWGTCRPRERTNALLKWADLIETNAEDLARLETVPSTRLISQTFAGDIAVTAEQIRFFAELADKEGGDVVPTASSQLGLIVTEPYGVVGAITPWNFPISMAGWKLAPALAAGNAVVLKPSELTPFSTLRMAELSVAAGIPEGLVNIVLGDGPVTGNALTGHPNIAKVSFTGSTRAGSAIMANIARTGIKPMTLELGGKSPQIVFADADVALAADCISRSILFNGGQACVAGSRIIVHASIAEALIKALKEKTVGLLPGPAWKEETTYSPIISQTQRTRIQGLVDAAVGDGAEVMFGGQPLDRPGYFYAPTLLTNVNQQSTAIREEIFGPVMTLQTFETDEEAFALADHPTYGLAAGLYTRDMGRALKSLNAIEAGTIWINRYGRSRDHILPTGGYKSSGIGKDLGREAYQANRRSKSVLIDL